MATYKLIQDIEAEDHILGPLTLRQFIYGLAAAFMYYICFIVVTKHVFALLILLLPPALFATFFAFPFKRDQPTEVWALAKLRYIMKPKRRLWSQSGVKELVTITVPKKIEQHLTKNLTQSEVKSRLEVLALTIDSRGWAVKNMVDAPEGVLPDEDQSDRLVSIGSIPKPVPEYDLNPVEDMLDDSSPQSQHAREMIDQSDQKQRQDLITRLNNIRGQIRGNQQQEVLPSDETSLSDALKTRAATSSLSVSNMHIVSPEPTLPKPKPEPIKQDAPKPPSSPPPPSPPQPAPHLDQDRLNSSLSNSDNWSIQTQANEAKKVDQDEVVINLH